MAYSSGNRGARSHTQRGRHIGRQRPKGRIFPTARIGNGNADDFNSSSHSEHTSGDELSGDGLSSDDEDSSAKIGAYSSLLQALNFKSVQEAPTRKKRKISPSSALNTGIIANPADSRSSKGDQAEDSAEALEVPTTDVASDIESVDEEHASLKPDPFEKHFAPDNEGLLSELVAAVRLNECESQQVSYQGSLKATVVKPRHGAKTQPTSEALPNAPKDLNLKGRLSRIVPNLWPSFDSLESVLAQYIFNYVDLMFCSRTLENASGIRKLACLHALNHIVKSRVRVLKNNERKAKGPDSDELELRDQGFTRPKVLIIVPTRNACAEFVEAINGLYQPEQQENKKRFQDSFVQAEPDFAPDKPADFRDLFSGNDDDMFRIGIKFTRKAIKYFSQFYNSDIIIGSPLGLRMAIGAEDSKKQDYDFLSSIEIIIIDRADALLMQNWENVQHILGHSNQQPRETHGCDFTRVRNWYLDGNAAYLRQTIVISPFNTPDLNSIFLKHMKNVAGKVKFTREYDASIIGLGIQVRQSFTRFLSSSPETDPDDRFKYFTSAVIPALKKRQKSLTSGAKGQGVLIFIPSYFDFVRVRNYFATSDLTQNISFGCISEYTSVKEVARARSHFLSGRHSVLLYTERAHHFRRYRIRGVKKVILYGLPDNPLFYQEVVGGYLAAAVQEASLEAGDASARSIFSKWDVLKLERVVGRKRVASLVDERGGDTFEFL